MKILLYGINFAPELTGIGKYTGEMAAWLVAQGHDVRVVTAPPYYPAWAVSPGYSGRTYRTEDWHGAKVLRCPLWVPSQPGGLKRLLHLASFALSSLPVMLGQVFWRPQVVWVVEPALFCAPTAEQGFDLLSDAATLLLGWWSPAKLLLIKGRGSLFGVGYLPFGRYRYGLKN
jgi:colanic acid biosynthesis glycosyl transferase WcaI